MHRAVWLIPVLVSLAFSVTPAQTSSRLQEGRAFHRNGEWDKALEAYADVATTLAESDPASAATARNNACVILMNRGDHPAALEECRQALQLRHRVDDPLRLGRTLNNLGLVLQYLGRYDEAMIHFSEAQRINRAIPDNRGEMINTMNLGITAIQAGRYSAAIERIAEALDLARRHPQESWVPEQAVRLARINQGVVFERLGAFRRALDTYKEVLREDDALRERQRASLLVNMGVVYRNLGDPVAAIEAFEEAASIYTRVGDRSALSNVHLNIGLVLHRNLDQPSEAESSFRRALELARLSGDKTEELQDLNYLGSLQVELGRLEEGELLLNEALTRGDASGTREGRWLALKGLADIARARGDLRGAAGRLREAMDEVEEVRASLTAQSLRSDYFGDKRAVYVAMVEILAELDRAEPAAGYAERALNTVQRAKARTLLDALGPGTRWATPLDASEIKARVAGELLLDYFVADKALYVWVVHRGDLRMVDLGPPQPILRSSANIHGAFSRREAPDAATVRELSSALLGPVQAELSGARTLRIAPNRGLHYLPFELLELPGTEGRMLVEDVTVSYLPTSSALARPRRDSGDYPLMLLGFGNPLLPSPSDGDRPTPSSLLITRFSLGPLPAAAGELESLAKWLPGDHEVRIGERATEEAFGKLTALGAHVVHLSSHTVVDETPGRGAAILLSPSEESDGLLSPDEIAALDYRAELTVLAACRTSLGSAADGDALASLTGAFLAAGSRAVVATLWDVEDQATRSFMDQFYYELSSGRAATDALRRAKLRLIADPEWKASGVWAAYVIVGETGSVVGRRLRWPWLLLLAAISVALLYRLMSTRRASMGGPNVST